jgi:hypothetical protein
MSKEVLLCGAGVSPWRAENCAAKRERLPGFLTEGNGGNRAGEKVEAEKSDLPRKNSETAEVKDRKHGGTAEYSEYAEAGQCGKGWQNHAGKIRPQIAQIARMGIGAKSIEIAARQSRNQRGWKMEDR